MRCQLMMLLIVVVIVVVVVVDCNEDGNCQPCRLVGSWMLVVHKLVHGYAAIAQSIHLLSDGWTNH